MKPWKWGITTAMAVGTVGCSATTEPRPEPQAANPAVEALVTNLTFAQISGGSYHSCGRTLSTGKLYCWGQNGSGELGNGTLNSKKRPTAVLTSLRFRWVSAGPNHTCAIATDYKAYCWGDNGYGQLGDDNYTDRWTPKLVAGGLSWKQIEAGGTWGGHTCGLTTGGKIYCWGSNDFGQLGDGTTNWSSVPIETSDIGVTYRQLAAGGAHTCAVSTANRAYCWGYAYYGQTGTGGIYYEPTAVLGGLAFRNVSAGWYHTCGTTTTGKAYCWGQGKDGALGNGTTTNRFLPRAVSGTLTFSRVFASAFHTCGLTTAKKAYCWGGNYYGQLGVGTTTRRLTPVAVKGGLLFSQLGSHGYHICGVTPTVGVGYCWGDNDYGQVGDATLTSPRLVPTKVAGAL